MSQRILVFENDAVFADEVKRNFERMGLLVDLASDGPAGLELAAAHRPDLILLTIELPGMNGFLVCKKIKKTVELEAVPLVILSSEVDQETFEQHKKLRTRADEYIRKPIAFAELLERVQSFVPASNGVDAAAEETALDIEEAFSVGDDDVIVLTDDDPAEEALDADEVASIVGDGKPGLFAKEIEESSDVTQPAAEAPVFGGMSNFAAPMQQAALREAQAEPREPVANPRLASPLRAPSQTVDLPAASAAQSAELERSKRELVAAEEKVQSAEKRASLADQRAALAEKSLDTAKRTGGASSRELLDLREQLNRKERELLDLREQVTGRDKQLIEASERGLVVERELQDTRDKGTDLQRELDKKTEVVAALTTDKENVRKRLDDAKARAERGEAKVKELGTELDGLKTRQQAEVDELRAQHAQADAALRAAHSSELDSLRQKAAAELDSWKQKSATELDEVKQKSALEFDGLQKQHATTLAARGRAHADELSDLREEQAVAHKAVVERLEQEKRSALDALRLELTALQEQKLAESANLQRTELASLREGLTRSHTAELSEATDKHRQEVARLAKQLSEAESRHALLEERHEETEAARTTAENRLRTMAQERDEQLRRSTDLGVELARAKAKAEHDEAILERVRKAMAIGLGLLEEQKQLPDA